MDLHAWINSIALVISFSALVLAIRSGRRTRDKDFAQQHEDWAEIRVKVDTMWKFLFMRATAEGVKEGLLSFHSPVRLINNSGDLFVHMADELQEFYRKQKSTMNERDLAIAIQEKFGERLLREICIPNNISFGVCILIATAVAKGEHTLSEILDEYHIPKQAQN